jgi:hypothetical protein
MRSKQFHSSAKTIFAIFITFLLASAVVPAQTQVAKFRVLHTFRGPDGAIPDGLLARDPSGDLYGTTSGGGTGKGLCASSFLGCGTAFKLNASGKLLW